MGLFIGGFRKFGVKVEDFLFLCKKAEMRSEINPFPHLTSLHASYLDCE